MLNLTRQGLLDKSSWAAAGILLPQYDINQVIKETDQAPRWIHFGAGNIFRAFIAPLQQKFINEGLSKTGIIAAGAAGSETFKLCFEPYDNLCLSVSMDADGALNKEVIASITRTLTADFHNPDWDALIKVFQAPSLQMASFTITEKGYGVKDMDGKILSVIQKDREQGPNACVHTMSVAAAMLYKRYQAGAFPLSMVSMDNCARNGDKLRDAILFIAEGWKENGHVEEQFLTYLEDKTKVSFPWTMIDKITPNPSGEVLEHLKSLGVTHMEITKTERGTIIAPFVNAEKSGYLVIEDSFAGGRELIQSAGLYFTDRETVAKAEKMKVGTCLNPLHTALALMGCLLGYPSISSEMKNADLVEFIRRMAEEEGMPVVENPGIIDPRAFMTEVISKRFPNPYIPDTPRRIATDTSQKIPVRFGETLKKYAEREDLNISSLRFIPFVLSVWLRYLLGIDDKGLPMNVSPDPMLPLLAGALKGIELGKPLPADDKLTSLLSNSALFGVDLVQAGLAEKVMLQLEAMIAGPGAVQKTLHDFLAV